MLWVRVRGVSPRARKVADTFPVTSNRVPGFLGINVCLMKTILPLTFIAALGAFIALPINFEVAGSMLFAAGVMAVAVCDYSRSMRPMDVPAPLAVTPRRAERFGLAA